MDSAYTETAPHGPLPTGNIAGRAQLYGEAWGRSFVADLDDGRFDVCHVDVFVVDADYLAAGKTPRPVIEIRVARTLCTDPADPLGTELASTEVDSRELAASEATSEAARQACGSFDPAQLPQAPWSGRGHPREEFDMYGQLLELGDWSYVLDDTEVKYRSGWYPYDKSVRLSPDVEFRSWRNEYVLVFWTDDPAVVSVNLQLITRPNDTGGGAMLVRVRVTLNLEHGTFTFHPNDLTGALLRQAQTKVRRITDLFAAERARRDTPRKRLKPITAADLQSQRESADG